MFGLVIIFHSMGAVRSPLREASNRARVRLGGDASEPTVGVIDKRLADVGRRRHRQRAVVVRRGSSLHVPEGILFLLSRT
jgi:hypothetical protein